MGDRYCIGQLTTANGVFRVTFFLKKTGDATQVKQLRIENSNKWVPVLPEGTEDLIRRSCWRTSVTATTIAFHHPRRMRGERRGFLIKQGWRARGR